MSEDSLNQPQKGKHSFTRRRFVQSTALLTGVSVTGGHVVDASPINVQESEPVLKLAQEAQTPGRRTPPPAAQKRVEQPVNPEVGVQDFIDLSEVLTGLDNLEPNIAAEYLERCAANPAVVGQLKRLTQTLGSLHGNRSAKEKGMRDALNSDDALFLAAEQIIYIWYIGAFFDLDSKIWHYGPPEHYSWGKVWEVIGTKPPMMSGGSPGFWSKPA